MQHFSTKDIRDLAISDMGKEGLPYREYVKNSPIHFYNSFSNQKVISLNYVIEIFEPQKEFYPDTYYAYPIIKTNPILEPQKTLTKNEAMLSLLYEIQQERDTRLRHNRIEIDRVKRLKYKGKYKKQASEKTNHAYCPVCGDKFIRKNINDRACSEVCIIAIRKFANNMLGEKVLPENLFIELEQAQEKAEQLKADGHRIISVAWDKIIYFNVIEQKEKQLIRNK